MLTQKQGQQQAKVQTMARHIHHGDVRYMVASLTYQEFPAEMKIDESEILSSLKLGFDVENWSFQKKGAVTTWEGRWEKGNRIVRLSLKKERSLIRAVSTVYRFGYRDHLAVESYLIEQTLLKEKIVTSFFSWPDLISRAHANTPGIPTSFSGLGPILDSISLDDLAPSSGPGLPPLPTGSGTGSSLLTTITGGVGTPDSPFTIDGNFDVQGDVRIGPDGRTSDQIDRGQNQIDRGQDQIDRALTQAQTTTDMVDRNWQDTNAEIRNSTDMVDRNWQETNRQAARANRTAERLADPKHMFLLSGATAAGAVVGGFAANLAIQGLISGVDWMIEQMTGRRAAAERWRQFQEARRNWETTLDHALALERSIDQFLLFHETLQTIRERLPESERSKLNAEEIIRFFNVEILMKDREKRRLQERFDREENYDCAIALASRITDLNHLTTNMSQVVSILGNHKANNPDIDIFDDRYFCSQMDHMMRNLLDAESALQRYRLHLINGQAEWRRDLADGVEGLQDVSERLQTGGDDILDRSISAARDLYQTNYDALRERLKRECRAQGMMFTGGCVSDRLEGPAAQELRSIEQARDQSIEAARVSAERRLQRPVTVNTDIEYDRIRSYQDWFEELEDQQFCNQRPDDPRCRELSQFRHNGVFYVKNRAMSRLESLCPQRQTTLSAIEAAQQASRTPASEAETPATMIEPEAEKKGFFSSLFSGIANFFRSIGEFFGFVQPRTVGERPAAETRETVRATSDQTIVDGPRVVTPPPRERAPATSPEPVAEEIITVETAPLVPRHPLQENLERAYFNPLFEDQFVRESLAQDLETLLEKNPEARQSIEQALEQLHSEAESATEHPFTNKVEEIYSLPEDQPGLRQFLLAQLVNSPSAYEQSYQALTSPEWTVELPDSALATLEENSVISLVPPALKIALSQIPSRIRTYDFYQLLERISEEKDNPEALLPLLNRLKQILDFSTS